MKVSVFSFQFLVGTGIPKTPLGHPQLKTKNWKLFGITLALSLALTACSREESSPESSEAFVPNTGQIQILNGCGKPGAAEHFRNFLTDQGFDIIEFGNAASWNYSHTMVVARTENVAVGRDLARVMGTDNLIHLFDPMAMVDATVFVGKDYEELIKRWQRRKP